MARRKPGALFPLELDILLSGAALQQTDGAFYGFALAKHLAEENSTALTAHGTLYKALSRMTEAGLLIAHWEDATAASTEGRPRRRLYEVTAEGARAMERAMAGRPVAGAPHSEASFA